MDASDLAFPNLHLLRGRVHLLFPELFYTNEVPEEEQVVLINQAMSDINGRLREIEALDKGPRDTECEDGLAVPQERGELEKGYQTLKSFLSPIRSVPPELWLEVFHHMLPIFTDSKGTAFLRVCSRWRRIAFCTPSLWQHFSIRFEFTKRFQYLDFIATCLAIGSPRKTPLNLYVYSFLPQSARVPLPRSPTLIFLSPHASRIHTLDCRLTKEQFHRLEVLSGCLSILQSLRVAVQSPSHAPEPRFRVFTVAPQLTDVSVNVGPEWFDLPWDQLTRYEGDSRSLPLLQDASNLRHLLLKDGVPPSIMHSTLNIPLTSLHLSALPGFTCPLLPSCTFPGLTKLVIIDACRAAWSIFLPPFLLRSSPPLTTLTMHNTQVNADELLECLRLVPTLQNLAIGEDRCPLECIGNLTVEELTACNHDGVHSLLSQLTTLRLWGEPLCDVPQFIRMLESRLGGSATLGTERLLLRRVHLMFPSYYACRKWYSVRSLRAETFSLETGIIRYDDSFKSWVTK